MPVADLLTWADAQPRTGAFGVDPSVTTEGVPAVGWYHGFLEIKQSGRRLTLTESSGQYRTWTNCTSNNQWTEWKPQALATPPQEFDLPLAEGIIATGWGASLYWKNQFDEVTVLLFVESSSGTISSQQTVALLPAGFRPSNRVSAPAYCNMSSGANGFVSIEPSGEIYITNSTNDVFLNGCAMISFIAAD